MAVQSGGDRRENLKPESSKRLKTEIDMEFCSPLAAAKFGFAAILIVIIITICFLHSYLQISLYHSYCQLAWLTRILTFYPIFHPSTFRNCVCFRGAHKKEKRKKQQYQNSVGKSVNFSLSGTFIERKHQSTLTISSSCAHLK